MDKKRIISQALAGMLIYFIISLILEKNMDTSTLQKEGVEAIVFGILYGAGLFVYYRFIKKK